MQQKEPPKIEFPCVGYPIKVLGDQAVDFEMFVISTLLKHAEESDLDRSSIKHNLSRNGRFISITIKITAQSEAQLSAIHKEFMDSGRVKMVM